jgi:hypothetical protein
VSREVRPYPNALRRIAIGFGGGFLFAFGPMLIIGVLALLGAVEWPPKENNLLLVVPVLVGWAIAIPFFLSAFSFVWGFRCPTCRKQLDRLTRAPLVPGPGNALRYYCSACEVEWDLGWQERPGD